MTDELFCVSHLQAFKQLDQLRFPDLLNSISRLNSNATLISKNEKV